MAAAASLSITPRDIPKISIISAHSIQKKTSQCLQLLYPNTPDPESPTDPDTLLPAVALTTKSVIASKAITIIEIIKRRMSEKGDHWYQYSALSSVVVEVQQDGPGKRQGKRPRRDRERQSKNNTKDKQIGSVGEEEEDPFKPLEEKLKLVKKKVPLLTIYISRSPLPGLARLYGEQSGSPQQ